MQSPSLVQPKLTPLIGACLTGDHQMRPVRSDGNGPLSSSPCPPCNRRWPWRGLAPAIGPNILHQTSLPTYAAADAAEAAQRPAGSPISSRRSSRPSYQCGSKRKADHETDEFRRGYAVSEGPTDGAVLPALRNARRNAQ